MSRLHLIPTSAGVQQEALPKGLETDTPAYIMDAVPETHETQSVLLCGSQIREPFEAAGIMANSKLSNYGSQIYDIMNYQSGSFDGETSEQKRDLQSINGTQFDVLEQRDEPLFNNWLTILCFILILILGICAINLGSAATTMGYFRRTNVDLQDLLPPDDGDYIVGF